MKAALASVFCLLICSVFPSFSRAAEKHLIYMQGCCVQHANGAVARDYKAIVQSLRDAGFNVFFELRTADETDQDGQTQAYAEKVAQYVQGLLAKGVTPEDITVSGFSLGSRTALLAAGLIAQPNVNYVLLAGCPLSNHRALIDYAKVQGRILSIVDVQDDKFGSCEGKLPNAITFKEIKLESGHGHKLFRLSDEASIALWKMPLEQWAKMR